MEEDKSLKMYGALVDRVTKEIEGNMEAPAAWGTLALSILKSTGKLAEIQASVDVGEDEETKERQNKLRALPFRPPSEVGESGGFDADSMQA